MRRYPFVQATAPERIYLAVSDDAHDAHKCFPDDHAEICWAIDDPVDVCVPYVRADLLDNLQAKLSLQFNELLNEQAKAEAAESLVAALRAQILSGDDDPRYTITPAGAAMLERSKDGR